MRFNPRTRVGCDKTLRQQSRCSRRFNPRTRVGCDLNQLIVLFDQLFQSTHPCGVRRGGAMSYANTTAFQSTHPCGVRQLEFFDFEKLR